MDAERTIDAMDERAGLERVLAALALEAGARIMEVYGRAEMEVARKADDSPVTEADLAADRVIAEGLARAFPEIPAVTEECAASHAETGHRRFFLVDPLDGTKEFVRRRGDFTVNIALIEDGRPVAGVVYAPARGRLFATRDGGAVEMAVEGHAVMPGSERAIRVRRPDNRALIVVASKSHRDKATDDFIAGYEVAEFRAAGSSLKFCLLAAGEADFYPRLGRTMEWDTAAGHAVLLAAGGIVLRKDDRRELGYGKPGWENPFFLAMAPGVEL
ncbi:MAG TPA: 3'(2'),5'-bisphosphate nucleotidase CysQ, partial [Paracoccaceae bacterium]|nr:3'(2'),5'-bisphosphate nucleotidase CysQ [Paracoccaceae bacterium]